MKKKNFKIKKKLKLKAKKKNSKLERTIIMMIHLTKANHYTNLHKSNHHHHYHDISELRNLVHFHQSILSIFFSFFFSHLVTNNKKKNGDEKKFHFHSFIHSFKIHIQIDDYLTVIRQKKMYAQSRFTQTRKKILLYLYTR